MQATNLETFGRSGEVALAFGVLAVVAMMVVPLPTFLLDLLFATNIAAAVTLLLVSLYVPSAVRLSTFPALLLLTTLFRLALNVSSTRLILLQADAGAVIDAFGHFVVQGNYVVGAVVFAILTLIQFIVVARGAERVSEVAARFALDAMPGRQMAIDADLRAGVVSSDEARRLRGALQRESQVYGALDGAMKFVKGDAIAAVVIIGINVVAGLLIGIVQMGMPAGAALETYTILTIGDGLVSQIPALLIATAAGIIVTRVSSPEHRPLGDEIARQLAAHPRAIGLAALLLLVLAAVPGLPGPPFAITAVIAGAVALAVYRSGTPEKANTASAAGLSAPPLSRLELHVSEALNAEIEADRERFDAGIRGVREDLLLSLGVSAPVLRVRVRDSGPRNYKLCIDEVPVARGEADGLELEQMLSWCARVLRRHADQFVDVDATRSMLDALEASSPELVASTVPGIVTLQQLTEVLRSLVSEDVSIRNLGRILGVIAAHGAAIDDTPALVAAVRAGLASYLVHHFADADNRLRFYEVERGLEDMVRGAVRTSGRQSYLALGASLSQEIIEGITEQTQATRDLGRRAIVVTAQPVRAHLRGLLHADLPDVVVLSRRELASGADRERIGWISL